MRVSRSLVLIVALVPAARARAQGASPPPPPCTSAEHRQFDFWIGEWDVFTPTNQLAGTNVITREFRDCVLHEHWTGSKGGNGESFNVFDASRKVWHQTWVDASGTLLLLDGGMKNGSMVLSGEAPGPNGRLAPARITWTPLPDGRVRQLWEASADGGRTWAVQFDGYYVRKRG